MIAGVFDASGHALTLTRPQSVTAGYTTMIHPLKANNQSANVVAIFNRMVSRRLAPVCNSRLTVSLLKKTPDVDMQAYDRLVLVWYDVPAPSQARLEVRCGVEPPLTRRIRVEKGGIETIRETLRRPQAVAIPKRNQ
jgi:hypothetical protein